MHFCSRFGFLLYSLIVNCVGEKEVHNRYVEITKHKQVNKIMQTQTICMTIEPIYLISGCYQSLSDCVVFDIGMSGPTRAR